MEYIRENKKKQSVSSSMSAGGSGLAASSFPSAPSASGTGGVAEEGGEGREILGGSGEALLEEDTSREKLISRITGWSKLDDKTMAKEVRKFAMKLEKGYS